MKCCVSRTNFRDSRRRLSVILFKTALVGLGLFGIVSAKTAAAQSMQPTLGGLVQDPSCQSVTEDTALSECLPVEDNCIHPRLQQSYLS